MISVTKNDSKKFFKNQLYTNKKVSAESFFIKQSRCVKNACPVRSLALVLSFELGFALDKPLRTSLLQ